jgi:pyruvate formate lyase activating enzyme
LCRRLPEHAIEGVDGALHTRETCRRCGTCTQNCQADARRLAGRTVNLRDLLAEIERDLVFSSNRAAA